MVRLYYSLTNHGPESPLGDMLSLSKELGLKFEIKTINTKSEYILLIIPT